MKLVLYSGGSLRDNRHLDERVMELIESRDPCFSYFPASSYMSHYEFRNFVNQFQIYGVRRFLHFPVDIPFDRILLREVLKSDLIFLGGGNTFYFLHYLRGHKLLGHLRNFVKRGGVLCGLSAGAIMMSSDIEMAGYPSFDRDENTENVKNLNSLKLNNFEFFPHYRNSARYDEALKRYSKRKKRFVYACPDGSGIIKNKESLTFSGKTWGFYLGKKMILNK